MCSKIDLQQNTPAGKRRQVYFYLFFSFLSAVLRYKMGTS